MIGTIIGIILIGLIAGALARFLVPGKDPMGIGGTILLGIVGSFIGGFLGSLLFGGDDGDGFLRPTGLIGSVIGAVIALLIYRKVSDKQGSRA